MKVEESNKITEGTIISLDLKVIVAILFFIVSTVSGAIWKYNSLISEIEEAKSLPVIGTGPYIIDKSDPNAKETWPPNKVEFLMKDQMTRVTLEQLIEQVEQNKEDIKRLRGD